MDIQYDVNAHSHNSSIQKKKTETEKKREREREVLEKKTREARVQTQVSQQRRTSSRPEESPDSQKQKHSDHPGNVFSLPKKETAGPTT